MIINRPVCSHCHKLVPERCDGRTFRLTGSYTGVVCKGRDGADLDMQNMRYLLTVGHGNRSWVPMEEEK